MTLQILFAPATNALGKPRIPLRVAIAGAAIMPACFLVGVRYGEIGLARAWLAAFPLLLAVTAGFSLPAIGASFGRLGRAILPGLAASAAMAAAVVLLDRLLPPLAPQHRIACLVLFGIAAYAGLLLAFARPLVDEALALAFRRRAARVPAQAL